MITKHLTDEEIQQYAFDRSSIENRITGHIHQCEDCKARAENYRLLFTGIKEQPQPSFDFDLAELVLSQLPQPKSKALPGNFFVYLLVFVAISMAGILCYVFREYLFSLFAGITPFLILLIGTTGIIVLIALSADMYKTYKKKMNTLDFY